MNCERFDAWLDAGRTAEHAAAARDHAASCPRCAVALRAAAEIEALLAAPPGQAPAGFAERVMARITAAEARVTTAPDHARRAAVAAYALLARSAAQPLAWWVDAAAQPATVLAFAVASLALWQRDGLWRFGTDLATGRWQIPALPLREAVQTPDVMTGIAIASLPLAALAAWALYHGAERLMGPPHSQRAAR